MSVVDMSEATAPLDPALVDYVHEQMTELQIPGVAVGIAHGDDVAIGGFGVTSIENPLSVNGDTVFQLGSITKTLTGTAIMREVDQGRIDLDERVRSYLPDFAVADEEISDRVTVRHLMTHTSGWEGDIFEAAGLGDDALATMVGRLRKLRQVTPFGTMWSYSNAAFYPLGRILEVLHGEPYETVMQREILAPLGIKHACYFAHDVVLQRFSVGHAMGRSGLQVARPWAMERSSSPVGTTMMNMKDLLRYARFHLGTLKGAQPVLSDATIELMRQPGMPGSRNGDPHGLAGGMGLTFMLGSRGGERIAGHGGSANGQPVDLSMLPDRQFAVGVFTNLQNPGHTLGKRITRWAYQHYFGLVEPALEPAAFGALDEAVGTYDLYGGVVEIHRQGDELRIDSRSTIDWLDNMDPPSPSSIGRRFIPVGPDTVAADPLSDENVGRFYRDADGRITWFHFNHRAARRRTD
ncbi:serine hydrolase domain-containing protein [Jatrophihabitans sp. DSM 45814]